MKDRSFHDFIIDQLHDLDGIRTRAMFGGWGIYHHEVFFGVIAGDELYFKTDSESLPTYLEKGTKPFLANENETTSTYYQVPIEIIEDPDELVAWTMRARQAQINARKPKPKKTSAASTS